MCFLITTSLFVPQPLTGDAAAVSSSESSSERGVDTYQLAVVAGIAVSAAVFGIASTLITILAVRSYRTRQATRQQQFSRARDTDTLSVTSSGSSNSSIQSDMFRQRPPTSTAAAPDV